MSPWMVTSDVHRYPAGWGWRSSGCVLLAQAESSPLLRWFSSPAPMLVQEKGQFLDHRSFLCTQKKEGALFKGQTFYNLMRPSWQVLMAWWLYCPPHTLWGIVRGALCVCVSPQFVSFSNWCLNS